MIDIIIPAYESYATIERTLASLKSQSDKNFKVYVVDDHSIPSLKNIVESSKGSLDLTYVYRDKNEGAGMARQTGIDMSNSDFFTFLDSDDVYTPWAVEVFNSVQSYDIDHYCTYFYQQTIKDGQPAIMLLKTFMTQIAGKMYRRAFIEKYSIRFIPDVLYTEDGYYNSICSELGNTISIPMVTYYWLDSPISMTRNPKSDYKSKEISQYFRAIRKSTEFILNYKPLDDIKHFQYTMLQIHKMYDDNIDILSGIELEEVKSEYKILCEMEAKMSD